MILLSRDPFLPSQRRSLERHLHLAWYTVSLDVTMSLTKGDKRVLFGQECLLCYLTFWPINVPRAQLQRWITHTFFSFNLQAVEGKEHRKFNSKLQLFLIRLDVCAWTIKICDPSRINVNLIPISMYE